MRYVLAFFFPWLFLFLQAKIGAGNCVFVVAINFYRLVAGVYLGGHVVEQHVCR